MCTYIYHSYVHVLVLHNIPCNIYFYMYIFNTWYKSISYDCVEHYMYTNIMLNCTLSALPAQAVTLGHRPPRSSKKACSKN